MEAFPDSVTILERGDTRYTLIGTAHVSERSVVEVQEVIDKVRPDTVCVELCQPRYQALTSEAAWRNLDIFKVIRQGKSLFLLAQLAIGAYQRRLGEKLGVKPGAELLAAVRKAEEVGAHVELVDREVHVTLKRTWAGLGFRKKLSLLGGILESLVSRDQVTAEDVEQLKQKAHLSEMLAEFAKALPEVKTPLIDERDAYLMSGVENAPGKNIVAVVGAAHVPGMKEWFGKPVDRAALEQIPPPSGWVRAVKWILPALILVAFGYGAWQKQGADLMELVWAWVLPNMAMAGLLTAVAGGKPLSILVATVGSPITSLNPLLGIGMVVGLVEAWRRKPTVADCENINRDVQSLRGFYKNPVTRVILVTVASTLGSALGAWIGASWLLALIA